MPLPAGKQKTKPEIVRTTLRTTKAEKERIERDAKRERRTISQQIVQKYFGRKE